MPLLVTVPFDHNNAIDVVEGSSGPHVVENRRQEPWVTFGLGRLVDDALGRIEARLACLDAKECAKKP